MAGLGSNTEGLRHPAEIPLLIIGTVSLIGVLVAAGYMLEAWLGPSGIAALAGAVLALYMQEGSSTLSSAPTRWRSQTADNHGYAAVPDGIDGIVLLSGGKYLYPHVDGRQLAARAKTDYGTLLWIYNAFSSHPIITKRLAALYERATPGRIF